MPSLTHTRAWVFRSRIHCTRVFFGRMEERGLPLLWHVADPEEFWDHARVPVWAVKHGWSYTDGSFPDKELLYSEVEKVLARHPRLPVIFAHFYFLSADLGRASRFLIEHPTVCFDLAPGVEMFHNFTVDPAKTRDFFLEFQDRIIYGTDSMDQFFVDQDSGRARIFMVRRWLETEDVFDVPPDPIMTPDTRPAIKGIGLPAQVLQKIYLENFTRLAGAEANACSPGLMRSESERIRALSRFVGGGRIESEAQAVLDELE